MKTHLTDNTQEGTTIPTSGIRHLCSWLADRLHLDPGCGVSITFMDTDQIADLHEQWLDEPGPTDVMSFPMDELSAGEPGNLSGPGTLGDIALCPVVAAHQANSAKHTLEAEYRILITHGFLHLLGHDHQDPEDETIMFGLQRLLISEYAQLDDTDMLARGEHSAGPKGNTLDGRTTDGANDSDPNGGR